MSAAITILFPSVCGGFLLYQVGNLVAAWLDRRAWRQALRHVRDYRPAGGRTLRELEDELDWQENQTR